MSAPVPYTFAEDFMPAQPHVGSAAGMAAERLREDIEALGYARGFDDGQASENAVASRRLADAAEVVAARLGALENMMDARLATLEQEASALALSFAQTLTLGLVPDAALVEETFRIALRDLAGALAVTVTLNPRVLPTVNDRLTALASGVNPNARIRLVADRSIAPHDCTIAWTDGDVAARRSERETHLATLIARAFPGPSRQRPSHERRPASRRARRRKSVPAP